MSQWNLNFNELVKAIDGKILQEGSQKVFHGVATDSRKKNNDKIFIALKGENFDAHDFLEQAISSGATCLIVSSKPACKDYPNIAFIKVKDTLKALQQLGAFWRKKVNPKVLGITGTNGKTTTKEYLAQLLQTKYKTCYAKGSFNNHWGVPLSLLELEEDTQMMVSEMGMNHPGELAELVRIANPDAVVVTMVGRGHLEGMGSIAAIAHEKEEIYRHSRKDALRAFNLDNSFTLDMIAHYEDSPMLTFSSKNPQADIYFNNLSTNPFELEIEGKIKGHPGHAKIPVFGVHNVHNLMAASALALAAGMKPGEIWTALPQCSNGWGRNMWVKLASGAKVLFDAYNANPESMKVFLENIKLMPKQQKKIFILGDMRELGEFAEKEHVSLGERIAKFHPDKVFFVGNFGSFFERGYRSVESAKNLYISDTYKENLASELKAVLKPEDIVFMKASRGVKLEAFLKDLDPVDFKEK